ncbi:phage tail length tape measure family protein [Undibacterium baiyunense]|uniref:Phage tail length tape measure family protein n=1 Tax=Undibacterium baiyunense TaxID=2828731 RepID=A0A941DJR4_9BURK|nr:phage tail length tape measure family protein [Undibacterium baiyunense]MBR7747462.1 phage tail length tape measure family protein [Undibacterium baiyunense]
MSDLKIQGEVSLDTTNADEALVKVEKGASRMAEAVGNAGKKAGTGLSEIGNGGDASAAKVDKSTKSIVASIQRATALMEAGSKTSTKYYEALANQRGVSVDALRPYLDQLEKVQQSQTKVGISAAQTSAAMRSIPAQFTDIITSLQGGQAPLTVFLQQGGQLKDMFGGAGNAAKALGGYVAGLVNPFTIAAAAATALGAAYYYGNEQSKALQKSLIVSGNYAGTTSAKLNEVAEKVGLITGKFSESREAVTLLAESGKFSFESIQKLSQSIVSASSVTGKSIGETISQFEKLKGDPAKAILELNQQYNFLTADIYKQIKALEERGEKERAGSEAIKAYSESVNLKQGKIVENLGYIEKAWRGIKSETLGAIDTFLSFGRAADDAQKLAVAKNQLQSMRQTAGNVSKDSLAAKEIAEQEQLIKTIEARINAEAASADAAGVASRQKKEAIDQLVVYDGYLKKNTETLKDAALAAAKNDFSAAVKGLSNTSQEYKKAFEIYQTIEKKIEDQFKEKKVAISREESAYKLLSKSISERIALSEMELRTGISLTEGQKLKVKLNELEQASNSKLAKSEIEKQKARLLLLDANIRDIDYSKKIVEEHANLIKSMDLETDSIRKQIESQSEYNEKVGLTKEAISELEIAKLNDIAAGKEQNAQMLEAIGLETDLIQRLRDQAKEYRELAIAKGIGAQKTQENDLKKIEIDQAKKTLIELEQESKRFYDDLYRGLSDSLYRGFEAGKGFFQSFWDGIKNLFKTTVLKLAVQGVMTGVLGLGAVGQAGAAQSNPLGQAFDAISTGKSIWEGFSTAGASFTSSLSSGITSLANLTGSNGGFLSSIAGGMNGAGVGSGLQSSLGLSIGQSAASVTSMMPYVAAAVAAFQGVKAINGDYRLGGLSADVGALLGIAPRLFGRKAPELQQSELSGTVGPDGFSATTRDVYMAKGGLFRSDKWSETKTPFADAAGLSAQYEAIKAVASSYAGLLGLSTDALASFSKSFTFNLSKTGDAAKDAEANQKLINDLFVGITNDVSTLLVPSIATFAKSGETASQTLQRLAIGLTDVNSVMKSFGFTQFAKSLEGSNAATRLAELTGGIEKLASGAQYFFENFLTEAEKIKPSADLVTDTMKRLGQSSVDTIDEFKMLVQGLDLATESGSKMYAELIAIAPQFKAVADFAKQSAEEVKKAEEEKTKTIQKGNAERAAILADRRAADSAQEAIKKASDEAFKTLTESVTSGMQSMLRAGNVGAALAAQMSITSFNPAQYTDAGGFNAGAFNRTYALAKANAAKGLMSSVSADALNVQDVSKVMQDLIATVFDDAIVASNKSNLIDQLKLPASDLIRTAMNGLLDAGVQSYMVQNDIGRGAGIASVLGAQMDYLFASFEGMGRDVVEYTKFVDGLSWSLDKGKISQGDYTAALEAANKIVGSNIDLLGNEAAQRERIAASQKALNDAGLNSVSFYFNQISKSVESLNEAASLANAPLAQVTAGIGRLTSLSDVFSQSAKAALSGGANLGNGSLINAQIVAEAAAKAASVITTADAAQAAKLLGSKESFAGVGGSQLRDVSLLLDGLKAFDAVSFEASFMRINDALNKGALTQEQYQDIFQQSLNTFSGVDDVTKQLTDSMTKLRDSMGSFADQILIDKSKTTLGAGATLEEIARQYDIARVSAMTGDSTSISQYQTLANQLLDVNKYKSRADYNLAFGSVYADARNLENIGVRALSQNSGESVVNELRSMNANLAKKVENLESSLMAALAQIAQNTKDTANNIEASNIT